MTSLIALAAAPQPKRKKKRQAYNIDELKALPIDRVAEALNVSLMKIGPDTWAERKDGQNASSLTLFGKTNSFVRFSGKTQGGVSKGSVIDFVMHVTDNPDVNAACAFLAGL